MINRDQRLPVSTLVAMAVQHIQIERVRPAFVRRLAVVAFVDVVEYSLLVGLADEPTVRAWSQTIHTLILPGLSARRGRLIDRAGDGLFIEFQSALDAFDWALSLQTAMASHRPDGIQFRLRIALHMGDIIEGPDGEVQGDGVNTAARLQGFASPGGLIVTQTVHDAVRNHTDVAFIDQGELTLRHIARPVRAYKVSLETKIGRPVPRWRWPAVAGTVMLAALCGVGITAWNARTSAHETATALLRDARAVPCAAHPCPDTWLKQRAMLEQAVSLDPAFAEPYADAAFTYTNFISSGLTLNRDEDLRKAEHFAERAAALGPNLAVAHEARGAVLRQHPDSLEAALNAYLRSLSIKPNQPSVIANAGLMLLLLGRADDAMPYFKRAMLLSPRHPRSASWMDYAGLAELYADRPGHGEAWFRQAVSRTTAPAADDIRLQYTMHLASALALDDQMDEAISLVRQIGQERWAVSIHAFSICDCSHAPGFIAGQKLLQKGLILAGVPVPRTTVADARGN